MTDITVRSTPEQVIDVVCEAAEKCTNTTPGIDIVRRRCKDPRERSEIKQFYSASSNSGVACAKLLVATRVKCSHNSCSSFGLEDKNCVEEALKECQLDESPGSPNYNSFVAPAKEYYNTIKTVCTGEKQKYFKEESGSNLKDSLISLELNIKNKDIIHGKICTVSALTELTECIRTTACDPEKIYTECGVTLEQYVSSEYSEPNISRGECYTSLFAF